MNIKDRLLKTKEDWAAGIEAINRLLPLLEQPQPEPAAMARPAPKRDKPKRATPRSKAPRNGDAPRSPSLEKQILELIQSPKTPEEFAGSHVRDHLPQFDAKSVATALSRLRRAGHIAKIGYGRYSKKKSPDITPLPAPPPEDLTALASVEAMVAAAMTELPASWTLLELKEAVARLFPGQRQMWAMPSAISESLRRARERGDVSIVEGEKTADGYALYERNETE